MCISKIIDICLSTLTVVGKSVWPVTVNRARMLSLPVYNVMFIFFVFIRGILSANINVTLMFLNN